MVSLATLATGGVLGTTDGSSGCHRLLKRSSPFYKLRKTIQSQLARAQSKAQLPTKPTARAYVANKANSQKAQSEKARSKAETEKAQSEETLQLLLEAIC
jgi:hypothetical protein